MDILRTLNTKDSTDSSSSNCSDDSTDKPPVKAGVQVAFSLMRHEAESGDNSGDNALSKAGKNREAVQMQQMSRKFVMALRQQLTNLQPPVQRRLDAGQLNQRLQKILQMQAQQRDCSPLDATSLWRDLTVRIRRPDTERPIGPEQQQPASTGGDKGEKKKSAAGGGGNAVASGSDGAAGLSSRTRQFRIRASGRCQILEAVRPLLARLGFQRSRTFSVTVGGFATAAAAADSAAPSSARAAGKVQQLGLLATVDSLTAQGVSELFLNFDVDLS